MTDRLSIGSMHRQAKSAADQREFVDLGIDQYTLDSIEMVIVNIHLFEIIIMWFGFGQDFPFGVQDDGLAAGFQHDIGPDGSGFPESSGLLSRYFDFVYRFQFFQLPVNIFFKQLIHVEQDRDHILIAAMDIRSQVLPEHPGDIQGCAIAFGLAVQPDSVEMMSHGHYRFEFRKIEQHVPALIREVGGAGETGNPNEGLVQNLIDEMIVIVILITHMDALPMHEIGAEILSKEYFAFAGVEIFGFPAIALGQSLVKNLSRFGEKDLEIKVEQRRIPQV